MRKIFASILILYNTYCLIGQVEDSTTLENYCFSLMDSGKVYLSWGCGYSVMQSENIEPFVRLILHKKYDCISRLIDSKNYANVYLGIIAIEILEKKRKIMVSQEMRNKIEELHKHEDIIYVCYGCAYRANRTLKDLLNSDNNDIIKGGTISNIKFYMKLANRIPNRNK